ncbi:MAG TPA: NADP-dependent oxidoreductase [Pyrinomonadaceae bacterium]|nr:NADP-dependent oxidoreductase [Pyrinomonadaceae bacterium]
MPTIPKTMRAAAIDQFGGPEVLKIQTVPVPLPGPSEVLIEVDTAGVGSWDADIRGGWSPGGRLKFPYVLGVDGSGTVVSLGSRIHRFNIGDRVYAYTWNNPKGGFYAEYVAVPADKVAPIPKRLDLFHAGAIPTTGLTALQGIDDVLGLKRDEKIIIHGASGGVGTLAVQFARLRHARVFASASGEDGVALALELGAHRAVDGKMEDIAEAARAFAPKGIDAVLALAGGAGFQKCLDATRDGSRVAYPNGVEPVPRKRKGIEMLSYDAVVGMREFERLNRALMDARQKIPIAATYSLASAARAHERIEEGHVLGKIVLRVRQSN